jgi:plastocyanin
VFCALIVASQAAPAAHAETSNTGAVFSIGVDSAGPRGRNFEYVDFFPREGVRVSAGDALNFHWNTGSIDGAHTASFLPRGMDIPSLPVPAPSGDEPGLQFNPDILFPSDPTSGETKNNPCVFDGSQVVSSGFIANGNPTPPYFTDFYVRLDPKLLQGGTSTDVKYVCELHPGMIGTVTLVSDARETSDAASLEAAANRQLDEDTVGALNAAREANSSLVAQNPDGTSSVTITAGTATQFVEVAEMLPISVTIKPGDTINWVTKTIKDPHTVTFPTDPGSDSVDPLPPACEAQPHGHAAAGGAPT